MTTPTLSALALALALPLIAHFVLGRWQRRRDKRERERRIAEAQSRAAWNDRLEAKG